MISGRLSAFRHPLAFSLMFLVWSLLPVLSCDAEEARDWRDRLREIIMMEMADKGIPSFALVVVDRDGIVAEIAEGVLSPEDKRPATVMSLYRTGSVGKTITDLAIMAAVAKGKLDINADVSTYLPDFHPDNPFDVPITLKHLMTHEPGLVREPPTGNYFDASSPSLEQTVLSLNDTTLLWEPGSKTKYSNAGLAVAGLALEKAYGCPFAKAVRDLVFEPAGMATARVGYSNDFKEDLAHGEMWWPDGRRWPAPLFDLGMLPAGDLYASPRDMAVLMQVLLRNDGAIVPPVLLEIMWRPHETPDKNDWNLDVGIGFSLNGKFLGRYQLARHGGAVYGYSTEMGLLPKEGLAVYAVATRDITNGVVSSIAYWALESALAEREEKPLPAYEMTGQTFTTLSARVEACAIENVPPEYARYVGVYGGEHNPLTVCVENGKLKVLVEWFFFYTLTEEQPGVFAFRSSALYGHEKLWFEGEGDRAQTAIIGFGRSGVRFERR